MKASLKFAFAVVTIVASGAVFAQNTPAKQEPTKSPKAQLAQSKGGQSAGAGQTSAQPAFAGFGMVPAIAATLTVLGAASTNDNSAPTPNH